MVGQASEYDAAVIKLRLAAELATQQRPNGFRINKKIDFVIPHSKCPKSA
jgi:hypothetical protein